METLPETLTDTLIERVDKLIPPSKRPPEWGHASMSTTPTTLAVGNLAARTQALEEALHEIALEVQKLSDEG